MNDSERENYSYLGDGVYAFFDGYGIWLRTGHHEEQKCDDKIYLEPDIISSLNCFVERIKNRKVNKEEL